MRMDKFSICCCVAAFFACNCKAGVGTGAQAAADADPDAPFSEAARRKLERTATYLEKATKESEANAPRTKLLDASELTEEDLRAVRKTEYFLPRGNTRYGQGPSGILSRSVAILRTRCVKKKAC